MDLKRCKTLVMAGIVVASASANAMSLSEFVVEVLKSDPELQQRVHSYRQVVQDKTIASAGWRPSVDATASIGQYDEDTPQIDDRYSSHQATLSLTQNLFNGFETTYAEQQAQARINSERYRLYDDADNKALEAVSAYLEADKQKRLLELAVENVRSHEKMLEKIRQRNGQGVGRLSDEGKTQARLMEAQAGLIAQQGNLQDALTKLHRLAGRYVAAEELETPEVESWAQQEFSALSATALENHPAILSAKYNIEAAEHAYTREKSDFYPKVDLTLSKMVGSDIDGYQGSTDDTSLVLNLTYNFYNGGRSSAATQKRISGIHEHSNYARKVHRQIIENLRFAWMANDATQKQVGALTDYVELSEKTLGLYVEEFYIGQRDLINILDTESELNRARTSLTNAQYDYFKSVYRLHEGSGSLFQAMNMAVEISDQDLRVISFTAEGNDQLPYDTDFDTDKVEDLTDECDNSMPGASVQRWGCVGMAEAKIGPLAPMAPTVTKVEYLNFDFDSDVLTELSKAKLENVVSDLKAIAGNGLVEVVAHTDSLGRSGYNQDLSQRRADAIRAMLLDAGFSPRKVTAVGRGEDEPVADNSTDEGRAKNRRVVFNIYTLDIQH